MNPISIDRTNKFVLGYTRGIPEEYHTSLNSYAYDISGVSLQVRGYAIICSPENINGPGHWIVEMGLFQDE